jgi:hypothetical protein
LGASGFSGRGSTAPEILNNHIFDLLTVQPQGRGPRGFRFRIVLDSAARGGQSSLDLATDAGDLLVTARDVDGVGDDLDLIIRSARSFTPIGVWINNHHGGFTKADAGIYAPSIWSDGPLLLSSDPTEILNGDTLLWHQSYLQAPAQRCPGGHRLRQSFIELADLHVPSRLTADPQSTRGPPGLPR